MHTPLRSSCTPSRTPVGPVWEPSWGPPGSSRGSFGTLAAPPGRPRIEPNGFWSSGYGDYVGIEPNWFKECSKGATIRSKVRPKDAQRPLHLFGVVSGPSWIPPGTFMGGGPTSQCPPPHVVVVVVAPLLVLLLPPPLPARARQKTETPTQTESIVSLIPP